MIRRWPVRPANRPTRRETGGTAKGADEASPRSGASVVFVSDGDSFAPRRERFFVSDGPISSNSGRNGGKNAGRNCVSALPQRAIPVHCHPRFPSRNRRFPDRCRSPDCASTAFRCRCLLLRQKLFVLPCRRLRNHYILCPTGTPTFAAARRQRRDLIIANASSAPTPTLAAVSGSGASGTSDPTNRQRPPPHQFREYTPPNLHLPAPRQGILKP